MKQYLSLLVLLFATISCSSNGGVGPNSSKSVFGWQTAGLNLDRDSINHWGTGVSKVTHTKNHLFAMNAKVADTVETYLKDYRMFVSTQGNSSWKELWLPNKVSPYSWYANDQYLYVGTDQTSELWRYDPESEEWTDMKLFSESLFRVYCISEFNGALVVNLSTGSDSTKNFVFIQNEQKQWIDINRERNVPSAFHSAVEYSGKLFVATYNKGVWEWNPADSVWTHLSNPIDRMGEAEYNFYPRSMTVHENALYVSFWAAGGIQKYLGNDQWQTVDSSYIDGEIIRSTTALDIYSLYSDGTHLFSAGEHHSIPTVYTAPDEPKGWRIISQKSYCPPDSFMCLGSITLSMTVFNDTLYSASWNRLLKFPLSDLAEGIADAKAYP